MRGQREMGFGGGKGQIFLNFCWGGETNLGLSAGQRPGARVSFSKQPRGEIYRNECKFWPQEWRGKTGCSFSH
jgi:hypothetical protein